MVKLDGRVDRRGKAVRACWEETTRRDRDGVTKGLGWTKGRRKYGKLRGGNEAGQRKARGTAVTAVASVSQDGVALN